MVWTVSDIPAGQGASVVITGVGGLGFETGLALARAGYDIVLAGRNPDKGRSSVERILATVPNAVIGFEILDLASLASVERFAIKMNDTRPKLDILVNNAGVMNPPLRAETSDGFELQFGTNYLGHFALTLRLLALLQKAQSPRVVSLSSIAHKQARIQFDDLQFQQGYKPMAAYMQSKLAMLMFALELDRRAHAAGSLLKSIAAHPGVSTTDLFINGPGTTSFAARLGSLVVPLIGHSAAAGAGPILYAATAPDAKAGGYYGPQNFFEMKGPTGEAKIAHQAADPEVSKKLWDMSEKLTGVTAKIA
jgi:NAD(P)-dependent dehydrogenase (short-subunit alcohol dehydrogenase family)